MKIGIVGAGNMGAALGTLWSIKGHEVMFSFTRDDDKLKSLAGLNSNTSSGTFKDAITFGEVVMLAVPFTLLDEILTEKELFENKIVITCVSDLQPDFSGNTIGLATSLSTSVAEHISNKLGNQKVVEAFNTTFAEIIQKDVKEIDGIKPNVFYCGDDESAKQIAHSLILDCGYLPIDAGLLKSARALETFASAWVQFAAVGGLFPNIAIHSLQY